MKYESVKRKYWNAARIEFAKSSLSGESTIIALDRIKNKTYAVNMDEYNDPKNIIQPWNGRRKIMNDGLKAVKSTIENWDIRCIGQLIDRFPDVIGIPSYIKRGNFNVEFTDNGWELIDSAEVC